MDRRFSIRTKPVIVFGLLFLIAGIILSIAALFIADDAVTEQVEIQLIEKAKDTAEIQEYDSKEVLDAIKTINSVTLEVQAGSEEMHKGGEGVAEEMRNLDSLTRLISDGMNEMASSAVQINNTVQEVNAITQKNKKSINQLATEVVMFKV